MGWKGLGTLLVGPANEPFGGRCPPNEGPDLFQAEGRVGRELGRGRPEGSKRESVSPPALKGAYWLMN